MNRGNLQVYFVGQSAFAWAMPFSVRMSKLFLRESHSRSLIVRPLFTRRSWTGNFLKDWMNCDIVVRILKSTWDLLLRGDMDLMDDMCMYTMVALWGSHRLGPLRCEACEDWCGDVRIKTPLEFLEDGCAIHASPDSVSVNTVLPNRPQLFLRLFSYCLH